MCKLDFLVCLSPQGRGCCSDATDSGSGWGIGLEIPRTWARPSTSIRWFYMRWAIATWQKRWWFEQPRCLVVNGGSCQERIKKMEQLC